MQLVHKFLAGEEATSFFVYLHLIAVLHDFVEMKKSFKLLRLLAYLLTRVCPFRPKRAIEFLFYISVVGNLVIAEELSFLLFALNVTSLCIPPHPVSGARASISHSLCPMISTSTL